MAVPEVAGFAPGLAILEQLLGQASAEGVVGVVPDLAVGRGKAVQAVVAGPGVVPTTLGSPTPAFDAGDDAAFGVVFVADTTGLSQTPGAITARPLSRGFRNGMAGVELDCLQQVAGKVVSVAFVAIGVNGFGDLPDGIEAVVGAAPGRIVDTLWQSMSPVVKLPALDRMAACRAEGVLAGEATEGVVAVVLLLAAGQGTAGFPAKAVVHEVEEMSIGQRQSDGQAVGVELPSAVVSALGLAPGAAPKGIVD